MRNIILEPEQNLRIFTEKKNKQKNHQDHVHHS